MALFGALVAVGLGPSMWLGAQFGQARVVTEPPPITVVERSGNAEPGGRGAAEDDGAGALEDRVSNDAGPLSSTPSARSVRNAPPTKPAITPLPGQASPSAPADPQSGESGEPSPDPSVPDDSEPSANGSEPPPGPPGDSDGAPPEDFIDAVLAFVSYLTR
jgi:hypothetical protein